MINWASVAEEAVGIMTAVVKKRGRKVELEVGQALFNLVRDKLKGHAEAENTLNNFANNPGEYGEALVGTLQAKAEADPGFGEKLKSQVDAVADFGKTVSLKDRPHPPEVDTGSGG